MKILVSGATGDIGRAVAEKLKFNNKLTVMGNSSKKLLEAYRTDKYIVDVISCDMKDYESIDKKLQNKEFDAYIHMAGVSYFGLVQDMTHESWREVMDINFNSAFYVTKNILPHMIRQKYGKVLFISSIWGRCGASYEVCYSASKGALDTYARALSKEVAPSNISVNSINLGMIDTKMNSNLSLEEKNNIYNEIPFGRAATTEECAEFIVKILDMPNYMTGQNIGFDGGW